MSTTSEDLNNRVRTRTRIRLAALGTNVATLCRAYEGEIVAGHIAPPGGTVRAWTIRGCLTLRNVAQLAAMLGLEPELLTNPDRPDASGRHIADLICDLDAYPPPPRLASVLAAAA
jgi:hypothetical protein